MKNPGSLQVFIFFFAGFLFFSCQQTNSPDANDPLKIKPYEPTWESLKRQQVPRWLQDGKFGIYTHWGIYAVHAMGPNATWYSSRVYEKEDSWQRRDFEEKYGKLSDGVGYKDLIPLFTAEKFDAEEGTDLGAYPYEAPAFSVTLHTPNGGEDWITGTTHDITWETTG